MRVLLPLLLSLSLLPTAVQANWWNDLLKSLGSEGAVPASLNADEVAKGLREALAKGTRVAVKDLGRADGFWSQPRFRVPLPKPVEKARKLLKQVGATDEIDQFHLALNRAAEQAVPVAAKVFGDAARQISIDDAMQILQGPDDAATQYFRRQTGESLSAQFRPLVEKATADNLLAQSYRDLVAASGPLASMLGDAADLDGYVTGQALEAVFARVAEEEAKIRRDPAARSSELLQRVFGQRDETN